MRTYWIDMIEYRAKSPDTLARRLYGQGAATIHREDTDTNPVHYEWWEVYVKGEWITDIFPD